MLNRKKILLDTPPPKKKKKTPKNCYENQEVPLTDKKDKKCFTLLVSHIIDVIECVESRSKKLIYILSIIPRDGPNACGESLAH